MKKFIVFILIMSAAFYYYMIHDMLGREKNLRVGMECAYVPNNWEEKTPSDTNFPVSNRTETYAEGYDVQIAKLIAKDIGANLFISKFAFEELLHALNNKQVDAIISAMPDSEENRQQAAFSDTYDIAKTEYGVLVDKYGIYSDAKQLSDLSGAKILGQRSTKSDEIIDQIPGVIHVAPVELVSDMIKVLNAKKVDGLVINLETGRSYERVNPNFMLVRFPEDSGFDLGFNGICIAVRKTDTRLLSDINSALKKIPLTQRRKIMDQTISRVWENL